MNTDALRIPKTRKKVMLWVHPEGFVSGYVFVHLQSRVRRGEERPAEVLNHPSPFLVLQCKAPDELRFYNKRSIIRLQYVEEQIPDFEDRVSLPCCLHMMDGSLLRGTIHESLAPDHARLFDYININNASFIELYIEHNEVCLVNKAYIVRVTPDD